jgi:hypothetical protein
MMSLDQAVINLHDVARLVEQQTGQGQLSEDIRNCADRLSNHIKLTTPASMENYDPVI